MERIIALSTIAGWIVAGVLTFYLTCLAVCFLIAFLLNRFDKTLRSR